jgi:lactate permease
VPQWLVANYHGPWLVDVVASVVSLGLVTLFLRRWKPGVGPRAASGSGQNVAETATRGRGDTVDRALVWRAWTPWLILSVIVFLWGLPSTKAWLDSLSVIRIPVPFLHQAVMRTPPVVAEAHAENAIYAINWLSATGSGIFLAAIIAGLAMGCSLGMMARTYWQTLKLVRLSLITISAMMAVGFTTRYSGLDATLGLAFAQTGFLYPFFGTMLGWLGVALTGSDTSSNVLFGSLQKITAEQLGLSPVLMAAANSSGGVMGKMIDAQSIVVASTATRWYGHEGDILRYVFVHSVVLACLVGALVMLQAYVAPFTALVR